MNKGDANLGRSFWCLAAPDHVLPRPASQSRRASRRNSGVTGEEPQDNDDRDRNPDYPKQ